MLLVLKLQFFSLRRSIPHGTFTLKYLRRHRYGNPDLYSEALFKQKKQEIAKITLLPGLTKIPLLPVLTKSLFYLDWQNLILTRFAKISFYLDWQNLFSPLYWQILNWINKILFLPHYWRNPSTLPGWGGFAEQCRSLQQAEGAQVSLGGGEGGLAALVQSRGGGEETRLCACATKR